MDEGTVARKKSNSENSYQINDNEPFKAIGKDVPEEIQKLLNMGDINFEPQKDQFFLLDDTAGQVAKYFNDIAGLNKIDDGIGNVKKWIRELEQDKKYKSQEIIELQEKIDKFDYLEELEEKVIELETLNKTVEKAVKERSSIISIVSGLTDINVGIKKESVIIKAEAPVNEILGIYTTLKGAYSALSGIKKIMVNYSTVKKDIKEAREYTDAEGAVDYILQLYEKKKDKRKQVRELTKIFDFYTDCKNRISKGKLFIKEKEKEFKDKFPETCPLCKADKKYQKL